MRRVCTALGISAVAALWAGLSGCTTGAYGRYYNPIALATFPPTKVVEIYEYTHSAYQLYATHGCILVGQSHFTGPKEPDAAAIRQAQKVGADVVLLASKYVGTRQGILPISQYQAPQTYEMQTFYGGDVHGWAHSTITRPGYSTTSWMPVSIPCYEQKAVFFRRPRNGEGQGPSE